MDTSRAQRGLSLVWCFVLAGLLAVVLMAGLFSMRYERNLFAEAWSGLTHTAVAQTLQKTQAATVQAVKPESAALRKCMVNGIVTYSNVECGPENKTGRTVEIQDTRGVEAPKAPPAATPQADIPAGFKANANLPP